MIIINNKRMMRKEKEEIKMNKYKMKMTKMTKKQFLMIVKWVFCVDMASFLYKCVLIVNKKMIFLYVIIMS